jgi:hypothetical protein
MPELTVRIPDELLQRIRHSAELYGRTVDEEAIRAFERHLKATLPDQDPIVAMIRETRDTVSYFAVPKAKQ